MRGARHAAVIFAVAFAVGSAAAGAGRINPGVGIDRCTSTSECVDVLTDPETCCATCGRIVVTRARRSEMEARCRKPDPRRHCRPPACGAPRPASPACMQEQCVDLGQ